MQDRKGGSYVVEPDKPKKKKDDKPADAGILTPEENQINEDKKDG